MTTLLADGEALIVRCDECRRLWPVTRGRVESHWQYDAEADRHLCPVCSDEAGPDFPAPH